MYSSILYCQNKVKMPSFLLSCTDKSKGTIPVLTSLCHWSLIRGPPPESFYRSQLRQLNNINSFNGLLGQPVLLLNQENALGISDTIGRRAASLPLVQSGFLVTYNGANLNCDGMNVIVYFVMFRPPMLPRILVDLSFEDILARIIAQQTVLR